MTPKHTWTDDNPENCSVTLKKLVKVMRDQYILRTEEYASFGKV